MPELVWQLRLDDLRDIARVGQPFVFRSEVLRRVGIKLLLVIGNLLSPGAAPVCAALGPRFEFDHVL